MTTQTSTDLRETTGPSGRYPQESKKRNSTALPTVGIVPKIIALASVFIFWQLITMTPWVSTDTLPNPIMVGQAFLGLFASPDFWLALWQTVRTWAVGVFTCAIIGIPLGLILGVSRRATQSTAWFIDFFRTIPTIALLPVALLLFGANLSMQVTMIVLSAVWPLLIQSMYAAKQVEPLLKWVFRVFRMGTTDKLTYLWAPSVALFVSTGMRLAATMALLMTVASEYLGGAPGLGLNLSNSELAFQRPEVFAYAITAGCLGLLINLLIVFFQKKLLWWHPVIREGR